MILLFGGTSETAELTNALARSGHQVLVSTATDATLDIGTHPAIQRRCGRLDQGAMVELIHQQSIQQVVDASHPYATELHTTVATAAQHTNIPCYRYQRQATRVENEDVIVVADHCEAAAVARDIGAPVLLTTGSRQLAPYVDLWKRFNIPLYARVLPHPESEQACDRAGLPQEFRIFGRGPFSEEENRKLICSKNIGVLITKNSGARGGVSEKINAAQRENCRVIIVQRPVEDHGYCQVYAKIDDLITAINATNNG